VIGCVDVDYQADRVTAACVAAEWTDEIAAIEVVVRTPGAAPDYEPGAFYQRELPYLRGVLARMPALAAVIVDAYVWLGPERPGLGWYLHRELGVPIIGVAKNPFAGADAREVTRGDSVRPLYVTAIGIELDDAVTRVAAMHGDHRIPTLLRRVDALARGRI
jgi:deoxyribonuclease V